MYIAFKHMHALTAVLSLLLTLAWSVVAWRGALPARTTLTGKARAFYIGNRVSTGLAGITGLAVTFVGPWSAMVFPYIGLAAFLVHGVAASWSKRALLARESRLPLTLLVQNAALLLAAYLMAAKPF